ncbi:unnamed protein product [Linum tenue]|uniref:Uncharacterized protein n=1 Tax=Linum tenue TaxID=586396 RepID=A0AAV0N583_9ROSI|nr:unnamed protein product [Linum tenue]
MVRRRRSDGVRPPASGAGLAAVGGLAAEVVSLTAVMVGRRWLSVGGVGRLAGFRRLKYSVGVTCDEGVEGI